MPIVISIYGILTWYFDQIISKNRGVAQPWYFPVMPSYWLSCLKVKKAEQRFDEQIVEKKHLSTVDIEKNLMLTKQKSNKKYVDGVRVLGLSKTYSSLSGVGENEALRNVFFDVNTG